MSSNTVVTRLPDYIAKTDAQPWPHKPGSYRFPKKTLQALGMTSRRANKLFRGEANPTIEEVNALCQHYGWDAAKLLGLSKAS